MILHGGIEDLLNRRRQAMNLVDEQNIARFEVGENRREVAALAGTGPEVERKPTQLARHDLRQRRLAEAGRPEQQHVVERAVRRRRVDEDLQIALGLLLADEFRERLRAERLVRAFGFLQFAHDQQLTGRVPAARRG